MSISYTAVSPEFSPKECAFGVGFDILDVQSKNSDHFKVGNRVSTPKEEGVERAEERLSGETQHALAAQSSSLFQFQDYSYILAVAPASMEILETRCPPLQTYS